jgi:hypothetical protein
MVDAFSLAFVFVVSVEFDRSTAIARALAKSFSIVSPVLPRHGVSGLRVSGLLHAQST